MESANDTISSSSTTSTKSPGWWSGSWKALDSLFRWRTKEVDWCGHWGRLLAIESEETGQTEGLELPRKFVLEKIKGKIIIKTIYLSTSLSHPQWLNSPLCFFSCGFCKYNNENI